MFEAPTVRMYVFIIIIVVKQKCVSRRCLGHNLTSDEDLS